MILKQINESIHEFSSNPKDYEYQIHEMSENMKNWLIGNGYEIEKWHIEDKVLHYAVKPPVCNNIIFKCEILP